MRGGGGVRVWSWVRVWGGARGWGCEVRVGWGSRVGLWSEGLGGGWVGVGG